MFRELRTSFAERNNELVRQSERGEGRSVREGTDDSESRRVRYVREAGDTSVASNIVEEVRNAKAVVDKYFSKVTE